MSSEAIGWVFRHSPYRGATFAVHLAIADSVNDQNDDRFWMKQARLADKARVTRGTVNEAIERMVGDGLLELIEARQALGRPNEYRLLMPPGTPESYARTLSAEPTRGARSADKGVRAEPTRGVGTADNMNPREIPTLIPTQDPSAADAASASFDAFWRAYPRGDGKPAARAAWDKAVKVATTEQIMGGLDKWLAYWTARAQPEFVPWAQKWLRQQQWNATPPAITGQAGPGPRAPITSRRDGTSGRVVDL